MYELSKIQIILLRHLGFKLKSENNEICFKRKYILYIDEEEEEFYDPQNDHREIQLILKHFGLKIRSERHVDGCIIGHLDELDIINNNSFNINN